MNKVAAYKEAIIKEALNKIAKEKKEKRPNTFNAQGMINKDAFKEYNRRERVKDSVKTVGGAMVGGFVGGTVGNKLGQRVTNKVALKTGNAQKGMIAGSLLAAAVGNAGQIGGAHIAGKQLKDRLNKAELNATKRLADKLYGDNKKIKDIATKKPRTLLGESYATNLVKAERAYKKETKKQRKINS